jgi:hypothetical protein
MTQEAQVIKWNCPCGNSYKFHGFTEAPQRTAAEGEDTRRAWIGLTHEDIDKAIENNQRFGGFRKVGFAYDLELVLKEKNTRNGDCL